MTKSKRILGAVAIAAMTVSLLGPRPAFADGAASTRNIILGGAAIAGTLIIINHNKKVHQRYAEDAQRQAALQAQSNDAQAAYESERQAYQHQVAINAEYKKEVALQHQEVLRLRRDLASANHTSQAVATTNQSGFVQPASVAPVQTQSSPAQKVALVSLGWGNL